MAAYASLQRSVTGQILSPKSLFEFANSEIPGIQLFWAPTTEIIKSKHLLEKRFEKSSTLPGSRSNHFFRPSSDLREILMLLVSGEEAVLVNISNFVIHDLKIGDYVACTMLVLVLVAITLQGKKIWPSNFQNFLISMN